MSSPRCVRLGGRVLAAVCPALGATSAQQRSAEETACDVPEHERMADNCDLVSLLALLALLALPHVHGILYRGRATARTTARARGVSPLGQLLAHGGAAPVLFGATARPLYRRELRGFALVGRLPSGAHRHIQPSAGSSRRWPSAARPRSVGSTGSRCTSSSTIAVTCCPGRFQRALWTTARPFHRRSPRFSRWSAPGWATQAISRSR